MTCCYEDNGPTVFLEQWPTARKAHKCCECSIEIKKNEKYERVSGLWDGRWDTFKTCAKCADLRDSLSDVGCIVYGELKDEYYTYLTSSGFKIDTYYNHFYRLIGKSNEI